MSCVVWAFPGMGKSSAADGKRIIDADYNLFQFLGAEKEHLHGQGGSYGLNPEYPGNYIDYVKELDAEIILVNCHISILENFENPIVIYPDLRLKEEYLKKYKDRGDHESFIDYMDAEFEGMLNAIQQSGFRKYKVSENNVHLKDVLERKELKLMFMTKKEMVDLLNEGYELLNSSEYERTGCVILGEYSLGVNKDFSQFAQQIFEGEKEFDFGKFQNDIERTKNFVAKELSLLERRGGLTHQELADKIMQGIVNGALGIRYSQIAPYSHGYEVTFGVDGPVGSTRDFKNRWECYCDFFKIGSEIAGKIENLMQNNQVLGKKCEALNIDELLAAIEQREKERICTFIPEKDTDFEKWEGYSRGSVTSVMDVHAGKGLDGIVKHHYHGTYSTMTPIKQNSLVEMMVCLNGFCLDCLNGLDVLDFEKQEIVDYLKKHGTDISTPEKLEDWIRSNPEKCGLEENRNRKLGIDEKITGAKGRGASGEKKGNGKNIEIEKV